MDIICKKKKSYKFVISIEVLTFLGGTHTHKKKIQFALHNLLFTN